MSDIAFGFVASEFALEMNEQLVNSTAAYESATVVYSTFVSDGYGMFFRLSNCFTSYLSHILLELNVKELLPPRMDNSGRTKYPVLFRV